MGTLANLLAGISGGRIEVVDLTAPLSEKTPVLQLPEPFANAQRFALHEVSRYDERGPVWYWNDITTNEHTGTHFDAPVHWASGREGLDVAQVPVGHMFAPAAVIDRSAEAAADPDYLLRIDDVRAWEAEHGPLPSGGWLLYRTGWDARSHDQDTFLNTDENGPHTPGIAPECAQWLAKETPIVGLGVETVGTDAGAAAGFEPAFPCHWFMLGAGKYGLTQLQNLAHLPATGAVVVAPPLPIRTGSGSPLRVLALVERGDT